jgi:hypothetical protein
MHQFNAILVLEENRVCNGLLHLVYCGVALKLASPT